MATRRERSPWPPRCVKPSPAPGSLPPRSSKASNGTTKASNGTAPGTTADLLRTHDITNQATGSTPHTWRNIMTTPQQATPAASKRKVPPGAVKAYIASLTGTSLEYYDFAIYSVASALVFPKVFFPGNDEYV